LEINMKKLALLLTIFLFTSITFSQVLVGEDEKINYSNPIEYELGGLTFSGANHLDHNALKIITGLVPGDKILIPGDKISKAITNLWEQKLFSDISIYAIKIVDNSIFLEIRLTERPRLSKFMFVGIRKGVANDLREKIDLIRGRVVTEDLITNSKNKVKTFFVDKGYLNTEVTITETPDTSLQNSVILVVNIKRNNRIKIKNITFHNNENITDGKLRRAMKKTKTNAWYSIFTISKFKQNTFEDDKQKVIAKYNEKGYRDAAIVKDTVYKNNPKTLSIELTVSEGPKYYFRNIKWIGNTKYTDDQLGKILSIKKGDEFNQKYMDTRLYMNPNGRDVTSLYMDDGYLFFSVTPVEVAVENDSIDFEIRIYEGRQASINKVYISVNTKTNDHVIMRELKTRPGQLFSRSDIIRSQRELATLGYFNAETLGVNPKPDPENGTVDIEYTVEEKPSDQIELSGGWGGNRIVGTLGVVFTNFSTRNFFKGSAWRPLPSGDGQRLSVRMQTTGMWYQSYNVSFTEPWLGGKKPTSLTTSVYHSVFSNGERRFLKDTVDINGDKIRNASRQVMKTTGIVFGLGKRLKWPDDFFTIYHEVSYQYYELNNYVGAFIFTNGYANNLSYRFSLARNSSDQPIFPRTGSQSTFSLQLTPPYSAFRNGVDYASMPLNKRFNLIEYHKWRFQTQWFTPLAKKLVLSAKMGYGFLGFYSKSLGLAPFERFYLGGDGLTNFQLDGREIIALRGYGNGVLSPTTGAGIASKYSMEMRFLLSPNPNATIYLLSFAEAGNSWQRFREFKPFEARRSAGFGIRIFMPMFGLLGLDWGYRFDDVPGVHVPGSKRNEIHFTIGGSLNGW
jgi:outer membrane protein insertion porin family